MQMQVYNVGLPASMNPLRSFHSHRHEVYCVSYNQTNNKHLFLSASWDDTVKLWSTEQRYGNEVGRANGPSSGIGGADSALATFSGHRYCVYGVVWHPHYSDVFASCSGDCTVKLWDIRSNEASLTMHPHQYEVLSLDINKYNGNVIATGSVDKTVKLWDMRNLKTEICTLQGHTYAVRRVLFSPFHPSHLYSCSYDMTMCLWDYEFGSVNNRIGMQASPLLKRWDHHSEFCVGLDASSTSEGMVASTGRT